MLKDEFLEEVWQARTEHESACGNHLDRIVADLQRQQEEYKDRLVTRPFDQPIERKIETTE